MVAFGPGQERWKCWGGGGSVGVEVEWRCWGGDVGVEVEVLGWRCWGGGVGLRWRCWVEVEVLGGGGVDICLTMFFYRAALLHKSGDLQGAIFTYSQAISSNPSIAETYFVRAEAYEKVSQIYYILSSRNPTCLSCPP